MVTEAEKQSQPTTVPSPQSIVKTMADMRQEYSASQPTKWLERPKDVGGEGTGEDYHVRDENRLHYIREISRHVERDDPAVSQGIGRFVTNVVQGGYTYVPDTGYDRIDRQLADRWATLTDPANVRQVDYTMRHNWHQHERLSCRRMIVDGDVGFLPLTTGQLQAFEGHRILSPFDKYRRYRYVVNGVEKNGKQQVTRYWLSKQENDSFANMFSSGIRDLMGVRAWQFDEMTGQPEPGFFHCFDPKRFSQSRGMPVMHSVLNTAGMHADLQFATLVKAQIASYIGFVHKIDYRLKAEYDPPEPEMVQDPRTGRYVAKGVDLSPGSSHMPSMAGEEIEPFTANIPAPEFFDQAKMLLSFISTTLDMPLILFLLDATETNFSAWRGAVQQFQMAAKQFQKMHSSVFHSPYVRFQQRRWLRQSPELRLFHETIGPDYFRHGWRYPTWKHIQPLEDVKAEVMELGNLLDSPRAIAARHNREFSRIITETCEDRAMAIRCGLDKAQELNQHPYIIENPHERVTWREVMTLPLSDSSQQQLLTGAPPDGDDDAVSGTSQQMVAA